MCLIQIGQRHCNRHQETKMGKFPFHNPNPNPNFNSNKFNNNSFSRKQISNNNVIDQSISFSRYVNFDISSLSKPELRKLKSQLISELDKVRTFSNRIESKKRSSPFPIEKNPKKIKRPGYVASDDVMKMCGTVLRKLSGQKAGMWFTSPVDAIGMGLHDYHTVINQPMDLGTIKDKLENRVYNSPEEFAYDVRLTFDNALRYNPKGHEVNTIAGQYLALFERLFPAILSKFEVEKERYLAQIGELNGDLREEEVVVVVDEEEEEEEVRVCSSSNFPSPKPELKPVTPSPEPVLVPETFVSTMKVVERSVGGGKRRLPKPKAKDPNKREMSSEEKQKLGDGLSSLPEEKMMQVIQIVRKRNGDLRQEGDEIELDIEAVDKETLWELDRFLGNYKKMVSKIQRQGLMGLDCNNVVGDVNQVKKVDVGEDDVDIGDEMPVNNYPPLEIDKDDDRQQSGSSSSSGSDSSSSGSDSGSSSGSDSDVDDAQSIDNGSKNFQH